MLLAVAQDLSPEPVEDDLESEQLAVVAELALLAKTSKKVTSDPHKVAADPEVDLSEGSALADSVDAAARLAAALLKSSISGSDSKRSLLWSSKEETPWALNLS